MLSSFLDIVWLFRGLVVEQPNVIRKTAAVYTPQLSIDAFSDMGPGLKRRIWPGRGVWVAAFV